VVAVVKILSCTNYSAASFAENIFAQNVQSSILSNWLLLGYDPQSHWLSAYFGRIQDLLQKHIRNLTPVDVGYTSLRYKYRNNSLIIFRNSGLLFGRD